MKLIPLSDVVNVSISVSPISAVRSGFNLGLIIGTSAVISKATRIKVYSTLEEMIADGFAIESVEYKAANLYFSQSKRPSKVVIGRWDITPVTGDATALEALTDCRAKNSDWYGFTICDATKADIIACAAYAETMIPEGIQFYTTADADVPLGTAGNVMLTLKTSAYKRSLGQYSTTPYAVSAIMGYAMGANTGEINSAYTLAYKQEVGVTPEDIDVTELTNITNANGNVYINQGISYNVFRQGEVASGVSFDEVLGIDVLSNDIQLAIMDLLAGQSKVPQTEGGVSLLVNSINSPCIKALGKGFITPGIWNGPQILGLEPGDTLAQGFMILAEPIATQSQADRDARKSPPIYVAVKLAGAIEFVLISVSINR
jgi:hypothetical protein